MPEANIPDHAMAVLQWLEILGLGAFLGALGQGIRVVVGVKKLHDTASSSDSSISDLISVSRLMVSLMIGGIAGALAAIVTIANSSETRPQEVLTLITAGYAGADFIEGFMRRQNLPPSSGGDGTSGSQPPEMNDGAVG
jgi:hypothetical protein